MSAFAVSVVVGAVLAVGWTAVWFAYLRPPVPSDQLSYLRAAEHFPWSLHEPAAIHQYLRFGLTGPTRLATTIFGYSQAGYYAIPLVASVLLLLATYAIGTLLFTRVVGVTAACALALATPVFDDASQLLPDLFGAALFASAVAIGAAVRVGALRARPSTLLAIGLLLGWSYLVREFVVFCWPLLVVLLWRRARWRDLLWVVGPIAGLLAAELAVCWIVYADPLTRVEAIVGHGPAQSAPRDARTYQDRPRQAYVLALPATLRDEPGDTGLRAMLGLTIVGGVAQLFARLRRPCRPANGSAYGPEGHGVGLLLIWCALLWVPLTLLGGVLDPEAPKLRLWLIRYWFPIFPALVLGGLATVWLAARQLAEYATRISLRPEPLDIAVGHPRRVVAWTAAFAVVIAAAIPEAVWVHGWWRDPGTRAGGAVQMSRLRTWLARHDATVRTIWTDPRTDGVLRVYRNQPFGGAAWSARIRVLRRHGPAPARGDVVLLYDSVGGRVCVQCYVAEKRLFGAPPRLPAISRRVYTTLDGVIQVYRVVRSTTRHNATS